MLFTAFPIACCSGLRVGNLPPVLQLSLSESAQVTVDTWILQAPKNRVRVESGDQWASAAYGEFRSDELAEFARAIFSNAREGSISTRRAATLLMFCDVEALPEIQSNLGGTSSEKMRSVAMQAIRAISGDHSISEEKCLPWVEELLQQPSPMMQRLKIALHSLVENTAIANLTCDRLYGLARIEGKPDPVAPLDKRRKFWISWLRDNWARIRFSEGEIVLEERE